MDLIEPQRPYGLDLSKYKGNFQNMLAIRNGFLNEMFGGSLLKGLNNVPQIVADNSMIPQTFDAKLTYIKKSIMELNLFKQFDIKDYNQANQINCGYYVLLNVRVAPKTFWDIFIYINEDATHQT